MSDKDLEPEYYDLCCDSCGKPIEETELHWTDSHGDVSCERCLKNAAAEPIGVLH